MKKPLLAMLMLAALPAVAGAQAARTGAVENGIKVIDFGIYKVDVAGYSKAPRDVAGVRFTARNIKLIRRSHKILAQPGLVFGVRYKITEPALYGKRLRSVIIFPKMKNPKTGKTGTRLYTDIVGRAAGDIMLFRFDFSWEMAEGPWSFRIYDGDKLLFEQKFQVIVALN